MPRITTYMSILLPLALLACDNDADVASRNISAAADNFEVFRRITFYNTHVGETLLEIQGYCSLGNHDTAQKLSVTCKLGPNNFKKHFMGLSHHMTVIAEQLDASNASVKHYRVTFKPSVVLPNIELR